MEYIVNFEYPWKCWDNFKMDISSRMLYGQSVKHCAKSLIPPLPSSLFNSRNSAKRTVAAVARIGKRGRREEQKMRGVERLYKHG